MKRTLALGLVLVSCASSAIAMADSRAWTAAKKVIPANMQMVGGINAAAAHGSALYQQLLPMALAKAGDAAAMLDGIKADCGIDVIAAIDSIAFGLDSTQSHGTVVVAFRGTNRAKLEACARKRAAAGQKTLAITAVGRLTKYGGMADGHEIYMRWLAPDVVAVATTPDDKDATLTATSGGVAGDRGLRGLGSVNTGASVWVVTNKQGDIPAELGGGRVLGAFGSANLAGGDIAVDMHLGVDTPATATAAAAKSASEVDSMRVGPFAELVKTVKIIAVGPELQVTARVPEQSVLQLLAMAGLTGAMREPGNGP